MRVHTHTSHAYTQYWCTKKLWHGKALKNPWLQSHWASCSQRAREAAGDRYTENQRITHTFLRHTLTQILLVTKCPICSKKKKWQSSRALKAPLFSRLKCVFLSLTNTHLKLHLTRHIPYWSRDTGGTQTDSNLLYLPLQPFKHKTGVGKNYSFDKSWSLQIWKEVREVVRRWFIIWEAPETMCCTWGLTDWCVMTHSGQ